jgi:hypothetical protein
VRLPFFASGSTGGAVGTTRRKGRCAIGSFETLLALYRVPQILLNRAKILGVNHESPPSLSDRSRVVSQSGKFGKIPSTTQKCHSDRHAGPKTIVLTRVEGAAPTPWTNGKGSAADRRFCTVPSPLSPCTSTGVGVTSCRSNRGA